MTEQTDAAEVVAAENLAVLKHEAETPMRGHDGQCCLRARLEARAAVVAARGAEDGGEE